ncbi:MAG: sigma-70 family RNA polymerase sigma factor [Spirochaetia bacterium]|nr:sigma-70 family RNA polymerase sigma factor [Spirochaetia bacterium]
MRSSEIEEVYLTVRKRLWAYIRSIVRDTDLTEDIFQKSWMKVIPAISSKGLNRDSLVPYLFRIARNECMDHFRKRTREVKALERIAPGQVAKSQEQTDHSLAIRTVIDECLKNSDLTESRRELLRLRLIGQLPVEEIASLLGLSRSTAYRELAASIQFLSKALETAGIGPEIFQES